MRRARLERTRASISAVRRTLLISGRRTSPYSCRWQTEWTTTPGSTTSRRMTIRAGFVKRSRTTTWRMSLSTSRARPRQIRKRVDARCARRSNANTRRLRRLIEPWPLPALRRGLEESGARIWQWLAVEREQIAGEKEAGQAESVGNLVSARPRFERRVLPQERGERQQ